MALSELEIWVDEQYIYTILWLIDLPGALIQFGEIPFTFIWDQVWPYMFGVAIYYMQMNLLHEFKETIKGDLG